ncbi:hypothetical protein RIF29_35169 [Crotalaria pallida]|uniref:Uncharacterized protein n=1 Tax=Crotalaria pallida TaxID=3830 RepID=A0AAN9EA38_CROPI
MSPQARVEPLVMHSLSYHRVKDSFSSRDRGGLIGPKIKAKARRKVQSAGELPPFNVLFITPLSLPFLCFTASINSIKDPFFLPLGPL